MERLTQFSLDHPRLTISGLVVITLLLGAGVLRLETDAGFRAYVGGDHPAVRRLDAFLERFGGGLPTVAVWSCEQTDLCESVFDPDSLRMAHTVATALERLHGVQAVASPATSPVLVPTPDGFDIRHFVEDGSIVADRRELAARVVQDPLWVGTLVSEEGTVGAIALELASSESAVNVSVLAELQRLLGPFEDQGFRFHLVGDPVEFVVAGAALQSDSARLVPIIVALIGAALVWLFRSWRAAFAALLTVGLAVVWSFGAMGWLGWPHTAVTQALAPFILVIGVCDAVHVLARYAAEQADARDALREQRSLLLRSVTRDVGGACLITSVTTAGGFLSFATSGAVSFVRFGVIAAVGVASALVLSFSLLPVLLERIPAQRIRAARASLAWNEVLEQIVHGSRRRVGLVLVCSLTLALLSGLGISLLRVEVDVFHLFGEDSQVVRWLRFVDSELRRTDTLEVEVTLPNDVGLEQPVVLAQIERLSAFLSTVDGLGAVRSVIDPLGWVNRLVHDDDPSYQHPGGSARSNAELLLLLSLQDPATLARWVSMDRRHVRLSVEAGLAPKSRIAVILDEVERYLASDLPPGWTASVTGPVALSFHMVEEVQKTQLRSFVTAALVVLALVALFMRSWRWAVIAMIPTLLPVVITLGAMGFWGIYLDMGTAMVGAVILGIAVDDTVHLLVQYRRRRRSGQGPEAAMCGAVIHVGRAVVTTSFVLALGFFVLTLSSWQSVASFGLLSGIAILGALVADIVVLPALVFFLAHSGQTDRVAA